MRSRSLALLVVGAFVATTGLVLAEEESSGQTQGQTQATDSETVKVQDLGKAMVQSPPRPMSSMGSPFGMYGRKSSPEEIQKQLEDLRQVMKYLEEALLPSLAKMMGVMIQGEAEYFAKPDVAENLATFTRQYYQALVARGFSEEQALKIVCAQETPLLDNVGRY